jgi:excisionase family DNA binding protein
MPNRASNPAQRPPSRAVAHIAGATRVGPVSKLRTIEETAELFSTSTRTVRRLVASGALPVHRLGRAVRISDADIAVFLATNRSV